MRSSLPRVGKDRALHRARDFASDVTRQDGRAAVAISGSLSSHMSLHAALQDDRDALAVSAGQQRVMAAERWRDIGGLRLARAAVSLMPRENPVQRLIVYDERNGTDLGRTLLLWFEEAGDAAAVARHLRMHVNSVRYRVRRAREVAGIATDDATARLLVHLLLRSAYRHSLPRKAVDTHVGR